MPFAPLACSRCSASEVTSPLRAGGSADVHERIPMTWLGLPEQASSIAPRVDALMYAVIGVTGFVALAIFAVMAYMGIRYRAGSAAPRAADVRALQARVRRRAELVWTLTPL